MSPRSVSLRSRIVATVTAVVLVYAVLDHMVQRMAISPSFEQLERQEALEDFDRVVQALRNEAEHLDMRCRDWATWDETWRFVQEPFDPYVAANLDLNSFRDGNVNLVYICDTEGRVIWGDVLDLESGASIELRELPRDGLAPNHKYLVHTNLPRGNPADGESAWDGYISGLTRTERGPMLISCRPILTSDGAGPVRGTVIMGRLLGEALVRDLARRTAVDFRPWLLDDPGMDADAAALLDEVTAAPGPVVAERDEEQLTVFGIYPDLDARPMLLLRADVRRDISARGTQAIRYALISTISAGVLLLVVLLGVLQRTVIRPIERLTSHALEIGRTDDASMRLGLERGDEIGTLGREFDSMLEKLAVSRAEVVKAARTAGMSTIATGILHNVGNVLNSVNLSATLVSERVRQSNLTKLKKLSSLVEKHGDALGDFITNDPKGVHFGPYVSEVTGLLEVERAEISSELEELEHGIEHIRQLVHSQQSLAGVNELREPTDLAQQLDQALKLGDQASPDGGRIEVVRDFARLPRVALDRHKLAEILVNLISNARQAMEAARVPDPTLTLRLQAEGDRVLIEVTDNGVGIEPENLSLIFSHGFTTREDGHGFGLHAAANAAVEMKGRLTASSSGPGRGATFVLDLPLETSTVPA